MTIVLSMSVMMMKVEGLSCLSANCAARKTSQASVASIALEVTLSRVLIEEFKLRCVAAALRRQKLYGG